MHGLIMIGGNSTDKSNKPKPENNPRESGYTLITGSDGDLNEDNQKQNNDRVGNKPEIVGWSI